MSKDLSAGAIFIAIAAFFLSSAWLNLEIGTSFRMGPGYFPVALAVLLLLLGGAIAIRGLVSRAGWDGGAVPWRGLALITAAPVAFALIIKPLGMVPAIATTVLLSACASRVMQARTAALLVTGLTLLCVAIFSYGLGVPFELLGPLIK
jgi:hypothetical protein